ncbi:MAG: DUF6057 family protein [Bacteroidales bacterium]|nr:DUF6057 family protein [Bacteroidales bacterium]
MKHVSPIFLFLAVLLTGCLCQHYTFIHQESIGLFLTTSDYWRETLSYPLPISNYIASFLVQFYRFHYVGPAFTACLLLILYVILLRLCKSPLLTMLLTCTLWVGSTFADSPKPLVASLLIAFVLLPCVTLLRKRLYIHLFDFSAPSVRSAQDKPSSGTHLRQARFHLSWGIAILTCAIVVGLPHTSKTEQWCRIERAAQMKDWDTILTIATPEATQTDKSLLPYALLSLAGKNQLGQRMFHYPITDRNDFELEGYYYRTFILRQAQDKRSTNIHGGDNDTNTFDESGELTYRANVFATFLYDLCGSTNEAIHRLVQASCDLPHGTSFGTLRQLLNLHRQNGNTTLAVKYCDILCHSTLHKSWAERVKSGLLPNEISKVFTPDDNTHQISNNTSGRTYIVMDDLSINLAEIIDLGSGGTAAFPLFLGILQADRRLDTFVMALRPLEKHDKQQLPIHYQETLLVAEKELKIDISDFNIDKVTRDKFQRGDFSNSYAAYYYQGERK